MRSGRSSVIVATPSASTSLRKLVVAPIIVVPLGVSLRVADSSIGDHRGGFDLHHRAVLQQIRDLHERHGRVVLAEDLAVRRADLLGRGEGAKIRYELENSIKGLEVLFADDHLKVKDVWQRGDEIRIFVEREETEEEYRQRHIAEPGYGGEDPTEREAQRQKEATLEKARFSWRKLTGNKPGAVVAQPEMFASSDSSKVSIDEDDYLDRVVTPDGKWVVATKRNSDWSKPKHIVRRNLKTGREVRVKLAPSDESRPIAFVPVHNKVLLLRAKAELDRPGRVLTGPDHPEYYLLDPVTGATQLVTGEFLPLYHAGSRFLQPTGQPNEFWAALPYKGNRQTEVGRYNLKDFSFKPVLAVPQIDFDSVSMWVDETRNQLYVVYDDQLLRMPLTPF